MSEAVDPPVILLLDDEKNIRKSVEMVLEPEGMRVIAAHDAAAALRVLHEQIVDVLIVDIQLGEIDGLTFFRKVRADGFEVPAIFISGHATLSEAAQAIQIGAYDFLEKPFSAERIIVTVRRCLEMTAIQQRLRAAYANENPTDIIGESARIKRVLADAFKVAGTQANVLIRGETGTGKELIATTIHAHSNRASGPLIKVNCSAIPDTLIESELFGYEKGAFTGAVASKRGLFELAHRGTLFLDEVADLSLPAQAKILRVLQSGEIQKVGAERSIKVDVRVLSGTHKDLAQCVEQGRFREDLYYRLKVVPLTVPSLRERPEDIPLLVAFFARKTCEKNNLREKKIETDVMWELQNYRWPGNVRELQNAVERMLIMSAEVVTLADLPAEVLVEDASIRTSEPSALKHFRDNAERDFIIANLRKHHGNISQSALDLGVGRSYLHRRMGLLKIAKKDYFA
jgi:DNA-binding NtrC family response regulator